MLYRRTTCILHIHVYIYTYVYEFFEDSLPLFLYILYIFIYIHIYIYTGIYICIDILYTYIYRERERQRERHRDMYIECCLLPVVYCLLATTSCLWSGQPRVRQLLCMLCGDGLYPGMYDHRSRCLASILLTAAHQ